VTQPEPNSSSKAKNKRKLKAKNKAKGCKLKAISVRSKSFKCASYKSDVYQFSLLVNVVPLPNLFHSELHDNAIFTASNLLYEKDPF
jgi:hypothetical protein